MANRAIYPGSFDPVTLGHLDIIKRSSELFDEVFVAVLHNVAKKPMFSMGHRMRMIKDLCASCLNVHVIAFDGLLVDAAGEVGANIIVKGVRNLTDYQQEVEMANINRLLSGIETIFLPARAEYTHISSRIVKELARYGGPLGEYVPKQVEAELQKVMRKEKET
ncbi:MAG: pantetheine-phosphate adenylyltransferase [Christensenellales bacterium]|jgi:pantetheine-phosphate adenylyltransferase|nr:pantetheine-phosphate adenylyltransferase [Clostridiales bacterium]